MDEVGLEERISRFLLDKRLIRSSNQTVKFNAFMPPRSGKLSVYRTSNLAEADIWEIGQDFVATPREKDLTGRADLKCGHITEAGLAVLQETTPHPLHADIVGWSMESEKDRLTAIKLAAHSKAITRD